MKPFKRVRVAKVESKREYFTRHGLHMNRVGKEKTSSKIAKVVCTMFHEQTREPNRLYWKLNVRTGQVILQVGII
jgi:hypothetical protein